MFKRAALSITLALVASVVLVACGGSDTSTSSPEAKDVTVSRGGESSLGEQPAEVSGAGSFSPVDANGGGSGLAPSDLSLDRKIIQDSSLNLQVEDVSKSYRDVAALALSVGGFVVEASAATDDENPQASVTIRVPSAAYEDVLDRLRGMAVKVENETAKAQDVTDQYVDLQARLRSAQALEAQYLEILKRAETIADVLLVQDRLTPVRMEIEQIQGQINALDTLSSMSTISVFLHGELEPQPVDSDDGINPLRAAGDGWEASLVFLSAIAAAVLVGVVFLWWLMPVAVVAGVGFLVYRAAAKRRETR